MNEEPSLRDSLEEKQPRREWVTPEVHTMIAGDAEFGGDTSVDGSAALS